MGKRGGRFRLTPEQLKELVQRLKQGALEAGHATEKWTLPRVAVLIQERFGERLTSSSVWNTLRRMGFSPQRPSKLARGRDEPAIRRWKSVRWAQLKI